MKSHILCVFIFSISLNVFAQIPEVQQKIENVALFKNGLGYFTSSITIPQNAKSVRLSHLPIPSFGTLWFSYSPSLPLEKITTKMEAVKRELPLRRLSDLLTGSQGKTIRVYAGTLDKPDVIEGTIVEIIRDKDGKWQPDPYVMEWRTGVTEGYAYDAGSVVLIKDSAGSISAINSGSIQRIDFGKDAAMISALATVKEPRIYIDLKNSASNEKIHMSYLARGITWSPSYLIDISDPKTAKFSAKAVLINEVANLDNVSVDLVTGFPNFQFSDVSSPESMTQSLAEFLNSMNRDRTTTSSPYLSNITQQVSLRSDSMSSADSRAVEYSSAESGTVSEDLFLYPLKSVSLRRGETSYIPLFTAQMPYEHIYIWTIEDTLDETARYTQREEKKAAEIVWHSGRITNTLEMPLTTAAAEFVRDGQIVGQDTCYYTAPKSKATIRINRAMNVLADQAEVEVERQRDARTFAGSRYDLVKLKGDLQVRNRTGKDIKLEITKVLSGEVLQTVPKASDTSIAEGLKQVNSRHRLVWELNIPSGSDQTATYTYQIYIRN